MPPARCAEAAHSGIQRASACAISRPSLPDTAVTAIVMIQFSLGRVSVALSDSSLPGQGNVLAERKPCEVVSDHLLQPVDGISLTGCDQSQ